VVDRIGDEAVARKRRDLDRDVPQVLQNVDPTGRDIDRIVAIVVRNVEPGFDVTAD
jgi:hypothetical protein